MEAGIVGRQFFVSAGWSWGSCASCRRACTGLREAARWTSRHTFQGHTFVGIWQAWFRLRRSLPDLGQSSAATSLCASGNAVVMVSLPDYFPPPRCLTMRGDRVGVAADLHVGPSSRTRVPCRQTATSRRSGCPATPYRRRAPLCEVHCLHSDRRIAAVRVEAFSMVWLVASSGKPVRYERARHLC